MPKFYILDSRGVVGNCALWWVTDGKGYTSDLAQAWLVDEAEARRIEASRDSDIAVPEELAKRHAFTHVRLDSLRADMEIPYRQAKPRRMARR